MSRLPQMPANHKEARTWGSAGRVLVAFALQEKRWPNAVGVGAIESMRIIEYFISQDEAYAAKEEMDLARSSHSALFGPSNYSYEVHPVSARLPDGIGELTVLRRIIEGMEAQANVRRAAQTGGQ